jgi:hypothetical protein
MLSSATNVMAERRFVGTRDGTLERETAAARYGNAIAILLGC